MILYIAPTEYSGQFDERCEELGEYLEHLPLEDSYPLKQTLSRYHSLSNFNNIVFFFDGTPDQEELSEAVGHLRRFHHARISVFAPEDNTTSMLFQELITLDVRQLVAYGDSTDLVEEFEQCISFEGMSFLETVAVQQTAQIVAAREYVRPELQIPSSFTLRIAVAGTQERIGVTTQAFSFYHALRYLGFTPCILDTGQTFITSLLDLYEDESTVEGSVVQIREMDFASAVQVETGHNAFIYDCGILTDKNADEYASCDLRYLCAGTKAWELPHLVQTVAAHPHAAQQVLFSFASKREEKEANEIMAGALPIAFTPYFPDIWEPGERLWHEEFLVPKVKELMGQ